ncbi:MAG: hypothetical protein QM704_25840 [Anaeromyxobacteraceae bacterium]
MPTRKRTGRPEDAPRTNLPPRREPYDEGYFGTEEEEGVQGSSEAPGEEPAGRPEGSGEEPRSS